MDPEVSRAQNLKSAGVCTASAPQHLRQVKQEAQLHTNVEQEQPGAAGGLQDPSQADLLQVGDLNGCRHCLWAISTLMSAFKYR